MLLIASGCSKKAGPEDVVVATVGDQSITVADFRRNYEFGLPHLKRDPDRKKSYLDYMIKEKVLSLEGYELGLDKSQRVQKLEQDLANELLIEELFRQEVNDKIHITPEEIKEAINRSKVTFKLRYWFEPNVDFADRVYQAMHERGYNAVVEDILKSNPEVHLKPKDFETDYISWLDVSDKVLDAIKELPIGAISAPIEMDGNYFIFQIEDIRRDAVTENEYQSKAESFRKILFYRKLPQEAGRYVSEFMTPKNVVTKGPAFHKLGSALAEWKAKKAKDQISFPDAVANAQESDGALLELKKSIDEPLVTFAGGQWTIKDFLKSFDPKSVKAEPDDRNGLLNDLNQQIVMNIRDSFLVKEAKKRGLQKSPTVKKELQAWRDKWVYEECRRLYNEGLKISDEQASDYFAHFRDRYKIRWDDDPTFAEFRNQARRDAYIQHAQNILNQKVDSLAAYFPIQINKAVLDTINTIESEKSRWMSLQVFKRSSNRLAVPMVDPAWGF